MKFKKKAKWFSLDPFPRSSFELTHILLQNNCINNGVTNGLKQKKEKKHAKQLYIVKQEKRNLLRLIKMPTHFLNKTCKEKSKTEKVNIIIEFCILEIVQVPNFRLKWKF